jgi:hypothetical protein
VTSSYLVSPLPRAQDPSGDYLNLADHPWSKSSPVDPAQVNFAGPAPAGTIVIDDVTGPILGVYPENGGHPHPTP